MREKLIELLNQGADNTPCDSDCWDKKCNDCIRETQADHLIAHGVTVQKWIPVTERLPEQGQEVIVYSGGVLKPTVFSYQFWNKNYDNWARITHWMPLPEPPNE